MCNTTVLAVSSMISGPLTSLVKSLMERLTPRSIRPFERTSMIVLPARYAPMSFRTRCSVGSSIATEIVAMKAFFTLCIFGSMVREPSG